MTEEAKEAAGVAATASDSGADEVCVACLEDPTLMTGEKHNSGRSAEDSVHETGAVDCDNSAVRIDDDAAEGERFIDGKESENCQTLSASVSIGTLEDPSEWGSGYQKLDHGTGRKLGDDEHFIMLPSSGDEDDIQNVDGAHFNRNGSHCIASTAIANSRLGGGNGSDEGEDSNRQEGIQLQRRDQALRPTATEKSNGIHSYTSTSTGINGRSAFENNRGKRRRTQFEEDFISLEAFDSPEQEEGDDRNDVNSSSKIASRYTQRYSSEVNISQAVAAVVDRKSNDNSNDLSWCPDARSQELAETLRQFGVLEMIPRFLITKERCSID
jgi:hypothetical protein